MSRLKTSTPRVSRTDNPGGFGGLAEASVPLPDSVAVTSRLSDYLELTKPRIAVLVLVTVSVGFALASQGAVEFSQLAHTLFGVALVAGASSALNQYIERDTDRLMPRTARRPLPAGRLLPMEVLAFGIAMGAMGVLYLASFVNLTSAVLTGLTLVLYAFAYTPLKRKTAVCTAVGAIPGALPPVLGWTGAGGELGGGAFSLFAIMFLWQFPHFLAIAWLYREQYGNAGLKMLPSRRPGVTGWLATGYALALVPVSLFPSQFGLAGDAFFLTALVLGAGYLLCSVRFMRRETQSTARGLLWSSLLYLPLLLLALTWDHFRLLQ